MYIFERIFSSLNGRAWLPFVPDELCLKILFHYEIGKKLNLKNPQTFNEKLQWMKLYYKHDEQTEMVDKCDAKKYVSNIIGEEYIIPTIGVWNHFNEIDFNNLPNQFVLKCTHDSGGLIICDNKKELDYYMCKRKISKSLHRRFFYAGREWPYKNVKPRIIAEKYMKEDTEDLQDYKFFCFNGIVKCFKIDFDRQANHKANYYDREKNIIELGEIVCPPDFDRHLELPENIDEMITIAEKLSQLYPFLRVDLYNIGKKIYFGELTFFPASGFGKFTDEKWDYIMGSWLKIPVDKK